MTDGRKLLWVRGALSKKVPFGQIPSSVRENPRKKNGEESLMKEVQMQRPWEHF